VGPTRRGKGTKCMGAGDGDGLGVGEQLISGQPRQTRFLASATDGSFAPTKVVRGIALIAPENPTRKPRCRTDGSCVGTGDAGKCSAPSPGWAPTGARLSATKTTCTSTAPSSTAPASWLYQEHC